MERANQTLQDRLVREMRLAWIDDAAAAHAWLPGFIADYNRRFAVPPRDLNDAHTPIPARWIHWRACCPYRQRGRCRRICRVRSTRPCCKYGRAALDAGCAGRRLHCTSISTVGANSSGAATALFADGKPRAPSRCCRRQVGEHAGGQGSCTTQRGTQTRTKSPLEKRLIR